MIKRSASARDLRNALKTFRSEQIEKFVNELSYEELEHIQYDWTLWARDDQLPPHYNDWTTWLILGGRGAGKTRAGAEWVRAQATTKKSRIALIGETLNDVRAVMIEGISGLLSIHPPREQPRFEPSKRQLIWPNGSIAQMYSADDPESLRGPQFTAAWCDELAKWRQPQLTWDMLQFALRLGDLPRQVITTTPKPIALLQNIIKDNLTRISRAGTDANANNLAPTFLQAIVKRYRDTRLGRQELDGEILMDRPDALWQRNQLEKLRLQSAPPLQRIIVSVDPPITSSTKSDACGIIIAGKTDDRAYILEDATMEQVKPLQWAKIVINMFHKHEADTILVEVNQGGEMVESVIRQIDPLIPIKSVRASRGKWLRAEPVAALYEQSRVAHIGQFNKLEDQMCDFARNGLSSGQSPDRLDALVWAVTELLLGTETTPTLKIL